LPAWLFPCRWPSCLAGSTSDAAFRPSNSCRVQGAPGYAPAGEGRPSPASVMAAFAGALTAAAVKGLSAILVVPVPEPAVSCGSTSGAACRRCQVVAPATGQGALASVIMPLPVRGTPFARSVRLLLAVEEGGCVSPSWLFHSWWLSSCLAVSASAGARRRFNSFRRSGNTRKPDEGWGSLASLLMPPAVAVLSCGIHLG
jgi:hypothetical protein